MLPIRILPKGGQIPAIGVTAYAGELNRHNAISAGFQRHISKPVDPETVVAIASELITKQNCSNFTT
ncbi:MAG: hypothetical protein KME01_10305 [Chroococcus sp. CMT-3BRIN-NPC107]|jgi:CheY-like chemotaxis protein|nr:hypothetical protein [Chroococcus sp. CMT-3BRIN-NPC107]